MRLFTIALLALTFYINAYAEELFLTDTDGNEYYIGAQLETIAQHEQHLLRIKTVEYELEGLLFYNPEYKSFKILAFENSLAYGYSIEGTWNGNGTVAHYVVNGGTIGEFKLNLESPYHSASQ